MLERPSSVNLLFDSIEYDVFNGAISIKVIIDYKKSWSVRAALWLPSSTAANFCEKKSADLATKSFSGFS